MLLRMARVELEVFVSVYGFPVEACFYSSIGIRGCLVVQKCDRSGMLVDGVRMRV